MAIAIAKRPLPLGASRIRFAPGSIQRRSNLNCRCSHRRSTLVSVRTQDIVSSYAPYLRDIIISTKIDDVFVVHYAGPKKPVDYLLSHRTVIVEDRFEEAVHAALRCFVEGRDYISADPDVALYVESTMT